MKIYLASRYSRYKEMQKVRDELKKMGFKITSRWIEGNHQISNEGLSIEAEENERIRFADEDIKDLNKADIVICFTEKPRTTRSRGGRHVEMGMAIAWEKKIYVVGYRENVFCCLSEIVFCKNYEDLEIKLKEEV